MTYDLNTATPVLCISIDFGGQWGYYPQNVFPLQAPGPGVNNMGFVRLGTRYYEPYTGLPVWARFLTRDPIGYEGGVNVYAYTGNNPVNDIDPTGLTQLWNLLRRTSMLIPADHRSPFARRNANVIQFSPQTVGRRLKPRPVRGANSFAGHLTDGSDRRSE